MIDLESSRVWSKRVEWVELVKNLDQLEILIELKCLIELEIETRFQPSWAHFIESNSSQLDSNYTPKDN